MDHLRDFWEKEIADMRKAVQGVSGFVFDRTHHYERREEERGYTCVDVACAIFNGRIIEGYDVGRWHGYRHPDPIRVILGKDTLDQWVVVIVAICSPSVFRLVSVYSPDAPRFYPYLKG